MHLENKLHCLTVNLVSFMRKALLKLNITMGLINYGGLIVVTKISGSNCEINAFGLAGCLAACLLGWGGETERNIGNISGIKQQRRTRILQLLKQATILANDHQLLLSS